MSENLTRRSFLRLTAGALVGGALAACGATPTATPVPKPTATTAPKAAATTAPAPVATAKPAAPAVSGTVDFFHVWGGTRVPLMDKQIADFKALYPNVTINNNLIPQEGMDQKYLTSIAGGTPPDVIMMYRSNLPNFAARNALTALDDLLAKDNMSMRKIFYDGEVDKSTWDGKIYAMPQVPGAAVYMMFGNSDVLKEAGLENRTPKTWQEWVDFSTKMTVKQGDRLTRIGGILPLAPFFQMIAVNGGKTLSDDGKKVAFDSPEGEEVLRWTLETVEKLYGGYEKQQAFAQEAGGGQTAEPPARIGWYQGKVGLYMDGVFIYYQMKTQQPNINYTSGLFPYNANNSKSKPINVDTGGWSYAIPKGSKNLAPAWEWCKYTTAGEGNKNFFFAQGRPSPVRAYTEDPAYNTINASWSSVVVPLLQTAVAIPTPPAWARIVSTLVTMVEETVFKKKDLKQALKDAAATAQKALDEGV